MRRPFLFFAPVLPLAAALHCTTPTAALTLEWTVSGEARADAPLPVDLWLHNTGWRGLWVLPALDGSSRDLRFPRIGIYALGDGEPARFRHGGCGNTNTLTDADFVWLAPGERLQLDASWSVPPLNTEWETLPAGTHTLLATYDATPRWSGFGDGGFSPGVPLRKLLSLPWGEITSPPLTITVVP